MIGRFGQEFHREGARLLCTILIESNSHSLLYDGYIDTASEICLNSETILQEL